MTTGKIHVTTENIFPVIKKFLYSDHDIFLRELVSNAVDATQKLKTLASVGDFDGELGDLTIRIQLDVKAKTLTITDRGIGMTAEEVEKYINQIAFSSAEEFLEKYKDKAQGIIGHFGLGFYSAFMVAKKVQLTTLSYKKDAKAVRWECDGSPEYRLEEVNKTDRGTEVVLYIDDESKEFLEESRISAILNKYCKFLPVAVAFGKEKEWKDGKMVETEKDNVINETNPLWTKSPSELKDEDYQKFYRELYPMAEEPLFHIHLCVDYPFTLNGILYFPTIKNRFEVQKDKIQLYCRQVFVTDSVEGVVPEFLTLLHGVIDSPDIPLNISRSYLQGDPNVKKISGHITKKVADKLQEIFKNDRNEFENKWDSLKIFIQYGMLTDDKFYERAEKFVLLKNTDNKYFTFEEYEKLIKETQTDKNKKLTYIYATNCEEQHSYIEKAKAKGYDVLLLDSYLDMHFVNLLERKLKDVRFVRVDADVADKLIDKEQQNESKLSPEQKNNLITVFQSQLPQGKASFVVQFEGLSENDDPLTITRSEFMRRMKDMAALGGGQMSFYGELPDSYSLVVNANHPLIQHIHSELEKQKANELRDIDEKIAPLKEKKETMEKETKGKKEEEISTAERDTLKELSKKIEELSEQRTNILNSFGKENVLVKQLIDLALLANNMLKGEELSKFVRRSIELINAG